MYVYVLSESGEPLMPTTRCGHVRALLKNGRARVVDTKPFIVQLMYESDMETQLLYYANDPGRTNLGIAVVRDALKQYKDPMRALPGSRYYDNKQKCTFILKRYDGRHNGILDYLVDTDDNRHNYRYCAFLTNNSGLLFL